MMTDINLNHTMDLENNTNSKLDDNNIPNINKRISIWKEKLIDLSKRNRLLNFKQTKGATIKIIDEIPPEIFRLLYSKNIPMEFLPININDENIPEEERLSKEELNEGIEFNAKEFQDYEAGLLAEKHIDKYLQTNLSEKDLEKSLRKISTTAKNTMDDLGFNVLFLTLGSVIWYERHDSNVKYESPLLLLPVKISKESVQKGFTIEYNDDEVILNPALALKLKNEFSINLDEIDISDIQDSDIKNIFQLVKERISKQTNWKLLNNIYIGLFSFAKFVMYKDLDKNIDKIKASKLIRQICQKGESSSNSNINELCPIDKLDTNVLPKDTYQILDADSSQQQAIAFVKENNNLVIEGPPGTGKSQTIANIIAELLSQGKKVLFVSQKIAALSVVQNRLESNGLAPYCLELHSNMTNRKKVLQELLTSAYTNDIPLQTGSSLDVLQERKIELNDYVKAVHTPMGNLNKKPFDALGIVCKEANIPDFEYIFDNYEEWDESTLQYKKGIFSNLKNVLNRLGNPKLFSWYGCYKKNLDSNYRLKLSVKEKFINLLEKIADLNLKIHEVSELIYINPPTNINDICTIVDIVNVMLTIPQRTYQNFSLNDEMLFEKTEQICEVLNQFNNHNNKIKEYYKLEILNEDIDLYISLYENYNKDLFSKFSFDYIKTKKYIEQFFIKNYKPTCTQILSDLKTLKEVRVWLEKLNSINDIAEKIYGKLWKNEASDEEELKVFNSKIKHLQGLLKNKLFSEDIYHKINQFGIDINKLEPLIHSVSDLANTIQEEINILKDTLEINYEKAFGNNDIKDINLQLINNKFKRMQNDIDDLTIWNQYLDTLEQLKIEKLDMFYKKLLKSNIDINQIDTAFEVQFLRVWLKDYVYQKSNILREFNSAQHNRIIQQFKNLDKTLIKTAKLRLIQKLRTNTENGINSYKKEFTTLEHQGKLQRLHKSLRQIINSIPNLLPAIKPCLMMSPLTVSQLLDPELFKFDYIIFDEASQLTTEDCIGSIIRGKKLIVAGDSQQLPPTSFFKTVTEPSESMYDNEDELEDLDSILDECSTAGFPKCMLKWHYRSKNEHLIAFSNKHLYKDLYTFPSAIETSETTGIKWNYHENTATSDANARLEEARLIALAVMEHAKKFPELTLGVATFNIKQKDLIEDEIAKLLNQDRSCADFFNTNKKEPFFVKNLESIQGDERDVIIISIGYFKNQNGILPMHFGPLNLDGGERRLNVLITRARYKIEIFSSIRYIDFDPDKIKSKGVALLKQYLEFAERGEVALLANTQSEIDDHFDSPFEEAVCNGLREAGLAVKTQVGCSGYKIDMAIRDEKNPGEFLLGIECDGRSYHSSATARDRDRLRQQILEGLGWKFYRIWSTDWFKNPQKELNKLLNHIQMLKNKDIITETNTNPNETTAKLSDVEWDTYDGSIDEHTITTEVINPSDNTLQINWNKHKVALLLALLIQIENGKINREEAINKFCEKLHKLENNNISYEKKDIDLKLQEIEYLYTSGERGIANHSSLDREIIILYRYDFKNFVELLKEINEQSI